MSKRRNASDYSNVRAKPISGRDENDAEDNISVANSADVMITQQELPQDPSELLQFYRDRIALFDQERREYNQKLEDCNVVRQEYYKLRWELNQRNTEIVELQRALSDAHIFLYDERDNVLALQAECDELKVQEMEDRRRIQHLLALTQPVTQEVTYLKDCRPTAVTRVASGANAATAAFASAVPSSLSTSYTSDQSALSLSTSTLSSGLEDDTELSTYAHRLSKSPSSRKGHLKARSRPSSSTLHQSSPASKPSVSVKTHRPLSASSSRSSSNPSSHDVRFGREFLPSRKENLQNDRNTALNQGIQTDIKLSAKQFTKPHTSTTTAACDHCGKATNIIRTIYLPNENAESLKAVIDSLRRQLTEQTKLAMETKAAYQEDRRIREQEATLHANSYQEKIKSLETSLQEQEEMAYRTTKDYFRLRYEFRQLEERYMNESASYRDQIATLTQTLAQYDQVSAAQTKQLVGRMKAEQQQFTDQFRKQVLDREENACIIKEQYASAQKMYESRLQYLTEQNQALTKKYEHAEQRRKLQADGFGTEVQLMRQEVKTLERRLQQVKLAAKFDNEESRCVQEPAFLAIQDHLETLAKKIASI